MNQVGGVATRGLFFAKWAAIGTVFIFFCRFWVIWTDL